MGKRLGSASSGTGELYRARDGPWVFVAFPFPTSVLRNLLGSLAKGSELEEQLALRDALIAFETKPTR